MPDYPCYWLEPLDLVQVSLRRYTGDAHGPCPLMPGKYSWHNAISAPIGEAAPSWGTLDIGKKYLAGIPTLPVEDPRWPVACGCGFVFPPDSFTSHRQMVQDLLYTGGGQERTTTAAARPGALWDGVWCNDIVDWTGSDGISLFCKTPDGEWHVDGIANNCAGPHMTGAVPRTHFCWERVGDPRNPETLTVSPSIRSGSYHGWLRNGVLVDA